jgi:tRNA-dihydrouridine synthase A
MAERFAGLHLSINGGIASLDDATALLADGFDGVMIGRAAYGMPADLLLECDRRIFADPRPAVTREAAVHRMIPYIERHLAAGGRLHAVTRHMLGLFAGLPGARRWRRILSEAGPAAGVGTVREALAAVSREVARAA